MTNCWTSRYPEVKTKWFPEQSLTPIQSYLNEFQHLRGKQGNMSFTCDHILDNCNSLAAMNPATLGRFTPTWYKKQLNNSNAQTLILPTTHLFVNGLK